MAIHGVIGLAGIQWPAAWRFPETTFGQTCWPEPPMKRDDTCTLYIHTLWLFNSSPWYRWPIEIDGLAIKNGGSVHGKLLVITRWVEGWACDGLIWPHGLPHRNQQMFGHHFSSKFSPKYTVGGHIYDGKSPCLIAKPSINGPFSMAMLNIQRVCMCICLYFRSKYFPLHIRYWKKNFPANGIMFPKGHHISLNCQTMIARYIKVCLLAFPSRLHHHVPLFAGSWCREKGVTFHLGELPKWR